MKLLSILTLLFTFSLFANDTVRAINPVILKDQIKVESFSSAVIPLKHVMFIGRLELRIKRAGNLFQSRSGLLRIMADGVEVDCVQFFSTTSRKWRSFIVNVGRTVRTLEVYNGLDRIVKIKKITKLPSAHYSRPYTGNPSEVLDLSSQLIDITSHLEHLISSTQIPAMVELRLSASDLMNKVQVLGPLKVTDEINALLGLFVKHVKLIEELKMNQITRELANELNFVETALNRLIN